MEIIKIYKESFPAVRLIGKRYTDADRENGAFTHKWNEWFSNHWFAPLNALPGRLKQNEGAYMNAMRVKNGKFEYWIGMFFDPETAVPEGYTHIDLEAFNTATCWLYGDNESGELYDSNAHNACLAEMAEFNLVRIDNSWCINRYNNPRFTTPDLKGCVILDYLLHCE